MPSECLVRLFVELKGRVLLLPLGSYCFFFALHPLNFGLITSEHLCISQVGFHSVLKKLPGFAQEPLALKMVRYKRSANRMKKKFYFFRRGYTMITYFPSLTHFAPQNKTQRHRGLERRQHDPSQQPTGERNRV